MNLDHFLYPFYSEAFKDKAPKILLDILPLRNTNSGEFNLIAIGLIVALFFGIAYLVFKRNNSGM